MHRFKVTLIGKSVFVLADCYVDLGGLYQFYRGDVVVEEFDRSRVVRVFQVW